jgi:hypothetical protein
MSTATPPTAKRYYLQQSTTRRFTVEEYHQLIKIGVLKEGEPTELLESASFRRCRAASDTTRHSIALKERC